MQFLNRHRVGVTLGLASLLTGAMSVPAFATGATYDIAPVTTSITSELTANLPIILGVVGGLFALGVAVRALRKFVKV